MTATDIFWLQVAAMCVGALVGTGIVLAAYFLGVKLGWWW
jgi:hypothetical protein